MTAKPQVPWRRRLSELGRGVGKPNPPRFAPLLYGVASQVEALPPADVSVDPTRLGKCLVELRSILGTSHLVVAAPSGMEAEALGAEVSRDEWPPRVVGAAPDALARTDFDGIWSASESLAASVEVTRRLADTVPGEPVLLAALTGPSRLLGELLPADAPRDATAFEFAGRALAALVRELAQAGASALLVCEQRADDEAAWSSALGTIANVARFHRIPALLAFADDEPAQWPTSVVPCPRAAGTTARPHGSVLSANPEDWADLADRGEARILVTATEVDAAMPVDALEVACAAALAVEKEN